MNLRPCCSLLWLLHVLWLLSRFLHYRGVKCSQQIEDQRVESKMWNISPVGIKQMSSDFLCWGSVHSAVLNVWHTLAGIWSVWFPACPSSVRFVFRAGMGLGGRSVSPWDAPEEEQEMGRDVSLLLAIIVFFCPKQEHSFSFLIFPTAIASCSYVVFFPWRVKWMFWPKIRQVREMQPALYFQPQQNWLKKSPQELLNYGK